jgi:hypothetical protein
MNASGDHDRARQSLEIACRDRWLAACSGREPNQILQGGHMNETEDPTDTLQIADAIDDLTIEDLEERYVQGKWECACSSCSCECCSCCLYIF